MKLFKKLAAAVLVAALALMMVGCGAKTDLAQQVKNAVSDDAVMRNEQATNSKDHYLMHPETRALLEKLLCMVRDLGRERTFAYMKFLLGCEKDY